MMYRSIRQRSEKESSQGESRPASSNSDRKEAKPIVVRGRGCISSVTFLADGKHAVSGGEEGKIRRWQAEDGKEVGTPMDAGGRVFGIAVSQDEKWVMSGTDSGLVTIWNAESHSKVIEFKAHNEWVRAVDVSPDGTKIATGSGDKTVCIWSLSTGQRLLGPLNHGNPLVAVKFSQNHLACAKSYGLSLRVRFAT